MEVVLKRLNQIKPYPNNPRKNAEAVKTVAKSIKEFGFRSPILIDPAGVIVAGHTRYEASKMLKLKEVPCIVVDGLTEEQIKAYRIADNSTAEGAEWDTEKLLEELQYISLDMSDFGLQIPTFEETTTEEPIDYGLRTRQQIANILNLGYEHFEGNGKYDIPEILPVYRVPPIKEWISFNYVLSDKNPEGKAVHFFIDDYQFERVWNEPNKYIEKLRQYVCVASPDFSPYGDMPLCLQIYNHYRKQWVGRYWQECGIRVIPTVRCSSDDRSYEWFLDGIPKESIIIMSSMWSRQYPDLAKKEYAYIKEHLNFRKCFVYGTNADMGISPDDNVEYIKNHVEKGFPTR